MAESSTVTDPGLAEERAALERIRTAHHAHLDRARSSATRLAAEAAEMTEEGIRDLVDEDAEVDAAVRAALVRQTSDRAMFAARRVSQLERLGSALAFGRMRSDDGSDVRIGRHTVTEPGTEDVLLIDWRAPAAMPFYRATPIETLGLVARRHLLYGENGADANSLTSYSDEVFDPSLVAGETTNGLRGEAAVLAAIEAPTEAHMRSVVATIQAEQDAVIRAGADRPLIVQGGPGTGKTVVALHRAAYLLYDQRAELSETGVLIVGPSGAFLRYIARVLPSLGESGVVSATPPELYPGIRRGAPEEDVSAEIKGRLDMATVLANAVADRQRRPRTDLVVRYGASRARLRRGEVRALFAQAARTATHNEGARRFEQLVIDALCDAVHDPAFGDRDDAEASFRSSSEVRRFLVGHWPTLTPEQALNDLLGSPGLLRIATRDTGLTAEDRSAIGVDRVSERRLGDRRWTDADVPLLDELRDLLGSATGPRRRRRPDRTIRAEDNGRPLLDADGEPFVELDLERVDDVAEMREALADLAREDRTWRFGHVIVDEAQDLSAMQWRMVTRRAIGRSMTVVGDIAQRTAGPIAPWSELAGPALGAFDLVELTTNYRSPAEIQDVSSEILAEIAPSLAPPRAIRTSGEPVRSVVVDDRELGAHVDELVFELLDAHPDDRVAVISERTLDLESTSRVGSTVTLLGPDEAKGLEFDSVVVVDPDGIRDSGPDGAVRLYIAVTRATQRLVLARLDPGRPVQNATPDDPDRAISRA